MHLANLLRLPKSQEKCRLIVCATLCPEKFELENHQPNFQCLFSGRNSLSPSLSKLCNLNFQKNLSRKDPPMILFTIAKHLPM